MGYVEKFVDYVDSTGIVELFDKYQKRLGDNRTLAAKECGITAKSVYDWENRSEDVKHSTKIKILEKLLEELPVETFLYITDKLYRSSSETLLSCLSTLYEQSFDSSSEKQYLDSVKIFESIAKQYAGLIYNNRELEVNGMFLKLFEFSKRHGYTWKPQQPILYDLDRIKQMIPQIISSWVYYGLPQTAEELSARTKFPLEIVSTVGSALNQQLLLTSKVNEGMIDDNIRAGVFIEGNAGMIMSTAGSVRSNASKKSSLVNTV